MILCSKYRCRHVCPPYWTSGRKKLALNNPGVPHRELKLPWPCRAPCHTHPAPDIHQACCLYQKLIILLRVDVCLLVFFLGICCNYVYIHSGDMPLICARVWANGFKVCLFLCVCVCAANTHPLSGSSFADGVPDVIGVLLPELSRGVQAWWGKEGRKGGQQSEVSIPWWGVSCRAGPCAERMKARRNGLSFQPHALQWGQHLIIEC